MSDKWMPPQPIGWGLKTHHLWLHKEEFDVWFDKEIRPLFENAVEVYGTIGGKPFYRHQFGDLHSMYPEGTFCHTECLNDSTHKALLIKIEPIKKEESAEDLIAQLCAPLERLSYQDHSDLLSRVRAFLARKK